MTDINSTNNHTTWQQIRPNYIANTITQLEQEATYLETYMQSDKVTDVSTAERLRQLRLRIATMKDHILFS